ncbi:glycosyltransferase 87 family protein [Streptomyces glomeratus]|uniref:Mannosyltransferase n=1 Tax=Streptomyces glomeratus TaxID=284452 RepID=A0ABP6L7G7_9ACTN|nr:glycosyltransferase 87 family protein [Streptomyces glomeratus]MCF1509633.1 glycosyltransferase 87 family protein [Streptomyces glomeratus]
MTRHAGWCLGASLTLHLLAVLAFPPAPLDLRVYREASPLVLTGGLYGYGLHTNPPIPVLPFTYPPFAALVFLPLAQPPWTALVVLWQAASVAAVAVVIGCADRLLSTGSERPARSRVLLWTAAGLWLEPVRHTLDQGQVNLLLCALVLAALAVPRTPAARGTGLGLAAAVKLTPAFGGLYLLATRQWRAAAWAVAAAAGATALAWVIAPRESARYWFGLLTDTQRIGPAWSVRNQSLRGALERLLGPDTLAHLAWWAGLAVVTALAAGAVRRAVRHHDLLGVLVCAELYGLLVSPIAWSHHWVWCLPTMMWLAHGPGRRRLLHRVTLAAWALATVGRLVPLLIRAEDRLPHPRPYPALLAWPGTAYTVCAVLSLLAIAGSPDRTPAREPGDLSAIRA